MKRMKWMQRTRAKQFSSLNGKLLTVYIRRAKSPLKMITHELSLLSWDDPEETRTTIRIVKTHYNGKVVEVDPEFISVSVSSVKPFKVHPDDLYAAFELISNDIFVYALFKNPFTMGGEIWQPKKALMEVERLEEVKGVVLFGCVLGDKHRIVEENGAIIGDSLEQVKKEILDTDDDTILHLMTTSKHDCSRAEVITKEEFVEVYNK